MKKEMAYIIIFLCFKLGLVSRALIKPKREKAKREVDRRKDFSPENFYGDRWPSVRFMLGRFGDDGSRSFFDEINEDQRIFKIANAKR